MPLFVYSARSRSGDRTEGTVDANDRRGALIQIERLGLVPISVKEAGAAAAAAHAASPAPAAGGRSFVPQFGRKRMAMREVLIFTTELRDLISSGMKLGNALTVLARRKTGKASDAIIGRLRDEIIQGTSLSNALAQFPDTFSTLYVSMIRAAEVSGAFSEVLERLVKHYERMQDVREKVAMALVYPLIVLSLGACTLIFSMLFVVPRFSAIFADLGSTLPLPTKMLMHTSTFLLHYGWALAVGIVFLVIALRRYLKTKPGRAQWDRMQLRLPLVRGIVAASAYTQFARTLASLLSNGVPVLQALGIVEHTIGNGVIAREIANARTRVTDGTTISGPLAAGGVFPPLMTDMLAVGEQTGDITAALVHIADRYQSELERNIKVFTTALEPILIVLMAVMVGFVAISMLLAVFEMTSGLNV